MTLCILKKVELANNRPIETQLHRVDLAAAEQAVAAAVADPSDEEEADAVVDDSEYGITIHTHRSPGLYTM